MITIFVKKIPGINDINLELDNRIQTQELDALIKKRLPTVVAKKCNITLRNGTSIKRYDTLQDIFNLYLDHSSSDLGPRYVDLELRIPICCCNR